MLAIILLVWLLIQTDLVQNYLSGRITAKLSKELKTEVSIKHVSIGLFDRMNLNGILVRDKSKDTLLYAGSLKVRVTDWFFLKDNIELKYIGLEDAVVKMDRSDSVWNYQFVIDYFTPETPREKRKRAIQLSPRKIDFKNVYFQQRDIWEGRILNARVGMLFLDARRMDFMKNIFKIQNIQIYDPVVLVAQMKALNPQQRKRSREENGLYFNAKDMLLELDTINVRGGRFTFHNGDAHLRSTRGVFDPKHIAVHDVNLSAGNYTFIKDTMRGNVVISLKERSGFDLQEFNAGVLLTPQRMQLNKLFIRTPESRVGNYLSFHYTDLKNDLKNFVSDILMRGNLVNTRVATNDIAYFAPKLKEWKKVYSIDGTLAGTVDNFAINDLMLKSSNDMYASGDLTVKGLPDVDNTLINFTDLNMLATTNELAVFAPKLRQVKKPDLQALGRISYRGNFTGTVHDFVTNGRFTTALGDVTAKLNMKLPKNAEPTYSGTIATDRFNFGRFLSAKDVGNISFNGTVAGRSFDIDHARADLRGHFNYLVFKDYTYLNIDVNGTVQNKSFTGELNVADSNARLVGNIEVDFTGSSPKFNVVGDLAKLDMFATKLLNKKVNIAALFDLNFEGKNIDDFIGSAKMLNAIVTADSTTINFDSLNLYAFVDEQNNKVLTLGSNEFDAEVYGKYSIMDLPATVQLFLNNYYPSIIDKPKRIPRDQQISFKINTYDFSKYAQLINRHLSGLNNAKITGDINTFGEGKFYVNATFPYAEYKRYRFENLSLSGNGNYTRLDLNGNIEKIHVTDSTIFPNTTLTVSSEKDHSHVKIFTGSKTSINEVNLDADVYTLQDGVRINFRPSYFVLNDKHWNLQERGEIFIGRRTASARNVKFSQGFQELTVESETIGGSSNNLVVKLKDVNLGDILPLVVASPRMEGNANGTVRLMNFYGPFKMEAKLKADHFRLENDSVGVVNIDADFLGSNKTISYYISSDNETYDVDIQGRYRLMDTTGMPLLANFIFDGTKATILNKFLGTVLSDIEGNAYGNLSVNGTFQRPYLIGDVLLKDAAMTVNFTKVRYRSDSINVRMTGEYIDLGNLLLKDEKNNTGIFSGRIYHNRLRDMNFDLHAASDKMLVLNTKPEDNSSFYGRAIGKVNFDLTGPQTNMRMNITGEVADSSQLFIPTGDRKEAASADFMAFKKYGKEVETKTAATSNLSVNMDLTVNKMADMQLILDPLTGDIINAKGNGRLRISIPAEGDITMRGRYNIESGRYDFNFQSFVPKPFEFKEGTNNYIEWNGDITKANLHIDAQYTAQNITVRDLLSNNASAQLFSNSNVGSYRGDVYVIVQLRGDLVKPDISFRLDFPTGSVIKSDPDFGAFLNRLATDDNEMLKQVTYLIVFNTFAPYGQGSNVNFASAGVNTISQLITSELNKSLSDALFRITGDRSLRVDISGSTYSSASLFGDVNAGRLDRQIINARVSKSILDGRVIVTFGNNFDFNINAASALANNNFQWLPDISVQIILSKDGRLRMLIFNRTSLGLAGTAGNIGRQNRQGISVSYSKDFDKLLYRRRAKDSLKAEDSLMRFKP